MLGEAPFLPLALRVYFRRAREAPTQWEQSRNSSLSIASLIIIWHPKEASIFSQAPLKLCARNDAVTASPPSTPLLFLLFGRILRREFRVQRREKRSEKKSPRIAMTEEGELAQNGDAGAEPEKKKRSVKVVKRVKSKKSEKSGVPDLGPPPATLCEEEVVAAAAAPAPAPGEKEEPPRAASRSSSIAKKAEEGSGGRQPARVSSTSSARRRAQRSGSNVFAMFTQNQVAQFKEAFGFIDQDKDGIISRSDIRASFDALGRLCSDKELDEMTGEAPGPINFTMFLSVFGDRIQGTDEEDVVGKAFASFDEGDGFVKEEK